MAEAVQQAGIHERVGLVRAAKRKITTCDLSVLLFGLLKGCRATNTR